MNKKEIASHLKISTNTLDNWMQKGLPVIKKGRHGTSYDFDLTDVEKWVSEHIQKPSDALIAERIRFVRINADRRELALEKERGLLLDKGRAQMEWQRVLSIIRNRLIGLPTKLAPMVCGTPGENFIILRKEIYHILDELGDEKTYTRKGKDDKNRTRKTKKLK